MKQILPVLLVSGLAATWVGCQKVDDQATSATPAPSPEARSETPAALAAEVTLVTLSVPNMV